jgi:tetratricopeptide (TPR) repeat protein
VFQPLSYGCMSTSWRKGRFVLAFLLFVPPTALSQSSSPADAAQAAFGHGQYAAAEELYRKALVQRPHSPELLTGLGMTLQMQGRSTAAISAFEQALRQRKLPRTYALLAEEKCKSGDLEGARPMLKEMLQEDGSEPLLLALVAPCYLDLNEPVQAVQVYNTLLLDPSFPKDLALIQLSKSYLLAARFFYSRLSAAPENTVYLQAIKDARDQASPDARGAFAAAAKDSPYFRSDMSFQDAVKIWLLHPQDTALLYLLSVLSSEESIRQIQLCDTSFPESPYFKQLQFEMLADQGREEEATKGYEELIKTHPELPDLPYQLGMLYRKQRLWDKAAAVFQTQLQQDPQDERSAARLSEALAETSQWEKLRTFLMPRVKTANPPLWAITDLAEADENLGDLKTAIRLLVSTEKTDPSNKTIRFQLIRLYKQTGDIADAQAESRWLQNASGQVASPTNK